MLKLLEIIPLEDNIKTYVTCAKDIFYYRNRKKDKPERVNLIYYCIYVLTIKKVTYKVIIHSQNTYLYKPIHKDNNLIDQMWHLRLMKSSKTSETKSVEITDLNTNKLCVYKENGI